MLEYSQITLGVVAFHERQSLWKRFHEMEKL